MSSQPPRRKTRLSWGLALLMIGFALLCTGPSLSQAAGWIAAVLVAGVGAFAIGWLVVGAALAPRGNPLLGVALSAALYMLVGVVAVIASESLAFGTPVGVLVRHPVQLIGVALIWPVHMLFALGWFGWGPQ